EDINSKTFHLHIDLNSCAIGDIGREKELSMVRVNSSIQTLVPARSLPCIEISGPISPVERMSIWLEWKREREQNIAPKHDGNEAKESAAPQQSGALVRLGPFPRGIG